MELIKLDKAYIRIDNIALFTALAFMAISVLLSYIEKAGLEKDLLVGTLRCFAQLMVVGYVLKAVFDANRWYWVVLAIIIMMGVGGYEAARRQDRKIPGAGWIVTGALGGATVFIMSMTVLFILKLKSWYNPQYIIPMMGMLIGNSMTGAALAINRLRAEIGQNKDMIEAKLSLGATAKEAAAPHLRSAIRSAMIPSINYLMVVGLVSLPGMMTGQIIAGADPADSVRYQVVIMYMISAAVAITVFATTLLTYRRFFTGDHQLRDDLL